MSAIKCQNENHKRMNVTVRFCSNCGEIVNKKIPGSNCLSSTHAHQRKSGSKYCVECGENLRSSL